MILKHYGIPTRWHATSASSKRCTIIPAISSCCVKTTTGCTDFFEIVSGVRQGCILSPFLFIIVIDYIMRKAMDQPGLGIGWKDDKRLTDFDFADDIALVAE